MEEYYDKMNRKRHINFKFNMKYFWIILLFGLLIKLIFKI